MIFLTDEVGQFDDFTQNARKKLEIPVEQALQDNSSIPSRHRRSVESRWCETPGIGRRRPSLTKRERQIEALESQKVCSRQKGEIIPTKITLQVEDCIHGTLLCLSAKPRKIPAAKIAVDKEWEKLQTLPAWM